MQRQNAKQTSNALIVFTIVFHETLVYNKSVISWMQHELAWNHKRLCKDHRNHQG